MISIEDGAANCNAIAAARADNVVLEISQQAKDKAHCFCLQIAEKCGEEAAVILQGLGYKVAKSTKVKDGNKWHYDPLRALEVRWPYLKASGIHGIIERQVKGGSIVTGRYNKEWWRDRTTWYSVPEALQQRALSNEDKLWFDVPVATQCGSIIAGTLYQHLRYQLLLFLAEHPDHAGTPYYRVNKSALARYFSWSLSTIKRHFKKMCEQGIIAERAPGEYTLCNLEDLVVPKAMQGRSSTEMRGGSSAEKGRSSAEMTGSSTEIGGSSTDNITHYKPFEKRIHHTHSLPAEPAVVSGCMNAADAAKASVHQDMKHNAPTVPVKAGSSSSSISTMHQLRQHITIAKAQVTPEELKMLSSQVPGLTVSMLECDVPIDVLRAGWLGKTPDQILPTVHQFMQKDLGEHGENSGWSPAATDLAILKATEIATGTFLLATQGEAAVTAEFKHCLKAVWDAYENLQMLGDHPDATAEDKAKSLVIEIQNCNQQGWPTTAKDTIQFKVPVDAKLGEVATAFFEEHTEVTTQEMWRAMSDCIEVNQRNTVPTGFDPLWKTRRGVKPAFLFKHWDDIQRELAAAEILTY